MRRTTTMVCFVILTAGADLVARRDSAPAQTSPVVAPKFDPSADPAKDLERAVDEARRTHRRILLDVGGEWCSWCHTLDRFYADHPDLMGLRVRAFVWVKINWSPENQNRAFLSRYPAIKGYPHLFVLDADGKLLHSQDTSLLEQGSSYNLEKMFEFLKKWAPEA
jgi:thiol:disulfide interchange protein